MYISSCHLFAHGCCNDAPMHPINCLVPSSCVFQMWSPAADLPPCALQPIYRWQCCLQLHLHADLLCGFLPQLPCRHHRKRHPDHRFPRNCQELPQVSHDCCAFSPRQVMYISACHLPRHDHNVPFALIFGWILSCGCNICRTA